MEVVAAWASVAAVADSIKKIGAWAADVKVAKEERQKLLDGLQRLRTVINSIDERRKSAKPGDEWYEGLLEMIKSSGTFSSNGEYQRNPNQGPETALSKLYVLLAELSTELAPAQGLKKYEQRLRYHWDKNKFDGLLRECARCQDQISFLLDHDHFKLSKAIREDGRETLTHVSEMHSRMIAIEHSQKRQEERQIKEKEELDRGHKAAFEAWLSPLEFQATQGQIVEQAFGTGKWFFDSLVFRHWVKGKPWHLRVHGVPGSGKVRYSIPLAFPALLL